MAVETDLLPPRYRSPKPIGRGGMGEIYRATDDTLGRAVAVKVLTARYAEDEAIRQRFTREALAAARLSGEPNIVTIFDVGEWNDRPFIVMEYLSGGSLDDRLRESGAQPPSQALAWLEQAAIALDAAHRNGVVHRDVKPGNLLLDRDDNVHVADFGIASAAGLDSLTMTGTVLGTAGYLSPEQANGDRATPASDRYALAVVAFELLSGERPFERDTVTAEAAAHVNAPVPSIAERCKNLPEEIDAPFRQALAKKPEDRFPTCGDFVGALRDALAKAAGQTRELAPVPPPPPEPPSGPAAYARGPALPRRFGRTLLVGLLLAAGITGAVLAAVLTRDDGSSKGATKITVTEKVTQQGRTVTTEHVTTAPAPPPPTPPATTPSTPTGSGKGQGGAPAGSVSEAIALTDQATGLMRSGDFRSALSLAQRALARLQGSGHTYEAYADYDVGRSLIELGRCKEGLKYVKRSEKLQGHRAEIDQARAKCGGNQNE